MESESPRRSKLVVVLAIVAGCYWVAMFVGTHLPIPPEEHRIPGSLDKLQHLTAFAGLAVLLCSTGATWGVATPRLIAVVLAIAAVYGVFDELTQAFVPRRMPDLRDWVANMLGAGLGIAVFLVGQQLTASRWHARPAD